MIQTGVKMNSNKTTKNERFNRFSVGLGLLDYINPILYTVTSCAVTANIGKIMKMPYSAFYVIG